MNAREHAIRLVVLKAIKERVMQVDKDAKLDAAAEFAPGDRVVAYVDGKPIGSVTVAHGRKGWAVANPAAFLAWCKEHRPTAVVEAVRKSDQDAILKAIAATGEVPDGVVETEGEPYFTVKPDYHAVQQLDWRPFVGQPLIEGSTSND